MITFEIKPSNTINVQAVYEALAHRRAATRAYVLLHLPPEQAIALDEAVADLSAVARTHGVGVVTAGDPSDYQTWEEREEAPRVEPDPERLDAFISTQLTERTRSQLRRSLR